MLTLKSILSSGSTLISEAYPSIATDLRRRIVGMEARVIGSSKLVYCSCHSMVPGFWFSSTILLSGNLIPPLRTAVYSRPIVLAWKESGQRLTAGLTHS